MPLVVHPLSDDPQRICQAIVDWSHQDACLWEPQMGAPADVVVVLGAEHQRMLRAAGWDKARVRAELWTRFRAQLRAGRTR